MAVDDGNMTQQAVYLLNYAKITYLLSRAWSASFHITNKPVQGRTTYSDSSGLAV